MLSQSNILCFANDWSTDPTSKHQLMRRFAADNRILWVESAGMRAPRLAHGRDLRRLAMKAGSFWRPARHGVDGLRAYAAPALPFPASPLARKVNARLYQYTLTREMARAGFDADPLMWVFVPHVAPSIRNMSRRGLVYYCVDKWTEFDDYPPEVMAQCEEELCRKADVVIASARDLADHCAQFSANVHYVPHGVDHAHFARALESGPLPADLANLPGPRVGFFGLLHEWVDLELIGTLAERLPYTFVLIGATNQDLSRLLRLPNVVHLGRRPYQSLPNYCRGFDAAIVPFKHTALTKSVNPIKLREYAAAGLPVVSSALPEVLRCADIATCVDPSPDTWVAALRTAVDKGRSPEARREQSRRVLADDWASTCQRVGDLVTSALQRKTPNVVIGSVDASVATAAAMHPRTVVGPGGSV